MAKSLSMASGLNQRHSLGLTIY
ncbi:UNVERIFIED_CONTAM: hypothetical protein GTU68_056510 [Idotea baltica]|nr:hypothetical protein [Idotea baltica]